MSFHGKNFVLTGVSSGIGAATAKALADEGAHVIGIDRNAPAFSLAQYLPCDLSDPEAIDAALAQIDRLSTAEQKPATVAE